MTRRFEFVGGNSAKFWQVDQLGKDVILRFGRLGTHGQQQIKTLPTPEAARRHVEKLVDQKMAKGYIETASV